jgi:hypothetical protein
MDEYVLTYNVLGSVLFMLQSFKFFNGKLYARRLLGVGLDCGKTTNARRRHRSYVTRYGPGQFCDLCMHVLRIGF